jgi:hypothetical protein
MNLIDLIQSWTSFIEELKSHLGIEDLIRARRIHKAIKLAIDRWLVGHSIDEPLKGINDNGLIVFSNCSRIILHQPLCSPFGLRINAMVTIKSPEIKDWANWPPNVTFEGPLTPNLVLGGLGRKALGYDDNECTFNIHSPTCERIDCYKR